jgi:hypothetical protein
MELISTRFLQEPFGLKALAGFLHVNLYDGVISPITESLSTFQRHVKQKLIDLMLNSRMGEHLI